MEALKCLLERRSIRKFKSQQITDEQLAAILEAGTLAATAGNVQSPVLVAVQDPATVKKLEEMNAAVIGKEGISPFYGAPTVVVVLCDLARGNCQMQDGSLAMGNLMNAAHAVGVDSCWINRATETFESDEGKALLKKWGLEGEYVGIGNCVLGYRDCEYPEPAPRKEGYTLIIR